MKFSNKIKLRGMIKALYMLAGLAISAYAVKQGFDDTVIYFGAALFIAGLLGAVQQFRLVADKDILQQREIAEKDERNISLMYKARSVAVDICVIIATICIFAFMLAQKVDLAIIISACILVYELCYLFAYYILQAKG